MERGWIASPKRFGSQFFFLMNILLMLILVSLALAVMALVAFLWAANSGQFEDTSTPSMRMLTDDPAPAKPSTPPERHKPLPESCDKKS